MSEKDKVLKIWPEIEGIKDDILKNKVTKAWAIKNSVLSADDLQEIFFSLLIKDCNVTFMNHKRTCVHLAVDIAKRMKENFGDEIQIDMDILIAGAILIDIGKLLEYKIVDDKLTTSDFGSKMLYPFSGVVIAARFDLPADIQHIIGTHSKEGDLGKRTMESFKA